MRNTTARAGGARTGSQGEGEGAKQRHHTILAWSGLGLYCGSSPFCKLVLAVTTTVRINSTHGPERGSLHFQSRQCGTASGRRQQPRPATTRRLPPRRGSCSSNSRHTNCLLPPPPIYTTAPPVRSLPTLFPTITTPPILPTAGSHGHRSSPSASDSSNRIIVTTNNNHNITSFDQPRQTTTTPAAAQADTGVINTASREGSLPPGHSGTCACIPILLRTPAVTPRLAHTRDCALQTQMSKTPPANPSTCQF